MKILLAADGSSHTKLAALHLATLAGALAKPPEVHLLNVHAPLPYAGAAAATSGAETVRRYHKEECEAALAVAEHVLRKAGVAFTSHWVVGDAAREIESFCTQHDIGLIVMGSHGHGALRTLTIGSFADLVLRNTRVPVTVVR